jgi:hypothetical protein
MDRSISPTWASNAKSLMSSGITKNVKGTTVHDRDGHGAPVARSGLSGHRASCARLGGCEQGDRLAADRRIRAWHSVSRLTAEDLNTPCRSVFISQQCCLLVRDAIARSLSSIGVTGTAAPC